MLFIGDDWAEAHHDIEIVNEEGKVLARRRLPEGVVGIAKLHELVADHLDDRDEPDHVLVGIETDRGRLCGLCDQPVAGGPLSRTPWHVGSKIRPR